MECNKNEYFFIEVFGSIGRVNGNKIKYYFILVSFKAFFKYRYISYFILILILNVGNWTHTLIEGWGP